MDKTKIKKAITVYVPGNICNLRCSYCYITECLKNSHGIKAQFQYSVEHMIAAFAPERLGGIAYITVIGEGETLIPPEVVPFVKGLLHQGHVVEIVTNNTIDERIEELLESPKEDLKRLIVKCSLHYMELKRLNKVESYFANIRKIIAAGASSYPFLVICEEYMPVLDEIREVCMRELGALPPCTPCVTADKPEDFLNGAGAVTSPACTPEFVKSINGKMKSRLFEEAVRFLDVDVRDIFCYAGKWSFVVEMKSGLLSKCHNVRAEANFFENINQPIECSPIGCECGIASCSLQYPLYGFGLIPEVLNVPTYTDMLSENSAFFNDEVKEMLNIKISDTEKAYSCDEERHFLMKKIWEKNTEITELKQSIRKYEQGIDSEKELQRRKSVEQLLAMVDDSNTTYDELKTFNYEIMLYIRDICNSMPGGTEMYYHVWEKIVRELLTSHEYREPDYIYHEEEPHEKKQILGLSIATFVSEGQNRDEMTQCMQNHDYAGCAEIICRQMKTLCILC